MGRLWHTAAFAGLLVATLVSGETYTSKHEAGRCAIRGSCGKPNFFSPELPCADNGLAEEPEDDVRKQLMDLCGPKWSTGPICCGGDQVCCASVTSWTYINMPSF
jgi:Niemann-Pick C1 protein